MGRSSRDFQKQTDRAHTAGKLAEGVVKRWFGLAEPQIEIKACNREAYQAMIKHEQLQRFDYKPYVIVMYKRGVYRGMKDGKKVKRAGYKFTTEEAFEKGSLIFYWIFGSDLQGIIKKEGCRLRSNQNHAQPYYGVRCTLIQAFIEEKHGPPALVQRDKRKHLVYGEIPKFEDTPPPF